jgi:hypothetical protein
MSKKRNRLGGQWSPRLIEMLASPAYRVLSMSAHRVISRIEIEHASHGGNENGSLPVTKQDFMDYGMDHDAIAPAIREAEALGFIRMKRGRGGNADHRQPNRFFLTFAHGCGSRAYPPTHEWRKIKTTEEAQAIAIAARAAKDPRAVRFAQNRVARNRSGKPGPKPDRKTRTENATSPVRKTRTTGQTGKPRPLSISRGGGRGERVVSCSGAQRDERHSRKALMAYVANVIDEQLHDLDRQRRSARRQAHWRIREQCPFDPVPEAIMITTEEKSR